MTPDPLLCERIAKRWCELMGLNPYETVSTVATDDPMEIIRAFGFSYRPGTGDVPVMPLHSLRWKLIAREVPAQMAWVLAIGEGV